MPIATRVTELFECRHPLQQAGIGGLTSPAVAIAVSDAGGLGMLSGIRGRADVEAQLDQVPSGAAVGINFLIPFLDPAALEVAAARCPYVELFWGEPDPAMVAIIHDVGALAGWQVGSADEGRAAQDAGCDVIVAQGIEAGGHVRGTTGLLPLLDEVRGAIDRPIIAAGGIGTGRAMAAALTAGADGVRVGTRFLAAHGSTAHAAYVDALVAATADDTVVTTGFGDGWPDAPHRVLRSAVEAAQRRWPDQLWSLEWPTDTVEGPVEDRALYAGQSVGAVRGWMAAGDIVTEIVDEAERLLEGSRDR